MQNILITGAASGLGLALARRFVKSGDMVYGIARHRPKLEQTAQALGSRFVPLCGDISDPRFVQSVYEQITSLDILVNNAGRTMRKPLTDITDEMITQMVGSNLLGHIYMTKYALPLLLKSPGAHIVNISSSAGLVGKKHHTVYAATKFGLRGFGEALTDEMVGTNIHVLNVYPGGFVSDLYTTAGESADATKGFMDPDDIAQQIAYALDAPPSLRVEQLVINRKK